jgi:hypothetical protein
MSVVSAFSFIGRMHELPQQGISNHSLERPHKYAEQSAACLPAAV